ncbi:ATP-binding protein, partial [Agromyces sp. NDB4Y10]|uniref:ATP-binding protein n=1 Tax=Agromyces sp. NDB4Y10 TaxID=1775951 RepID=UPI000B150C82
MASERRPRLTPPIADVRRAVREVLEPREDAPLLLVALSGGADSLALAAAAAFEAPRAGWRAGAVVVDHGLQAGSSEQADAAASVARDLGLDPVLVRRVDATAAPGGDGP